MDSFHSESKYSLCSSSEYNNTTGIVVQPHIHLLAYTNFSQKLISDLSVSLYFRVPLNSVKGLL